MGKAPVGHDLRDARRARRARETRFHETRARAVHGQGQERGRCRPARSARRSDRGGGARASAPAADRARPRARAAARRDRRARRGRGGAIELVGETGSGNSRLLARGARAGRGHAGLATRPASCYTRDRRTSPGATCCASCSASAGTTRTARAGAAARDEIDRTRARPAPVAAAARDRDRRRGPEHARGRGARRRGRAAKLHEVVLRFLAPALAVPTIVRVEHAHLMDAASAALLGALARELGSSAWLVLVTRREERRRVVARRRGCSARLELGPLSREDVAGARPGDARGRRGCRRTSSSSRSSAPAEARSSCSTCWPPRPAARDELPDSVEAATMARIDALDPRRPRARAPRRRARLEVPSAAPARRPGRGHAAARRRALGAAVRHLRARGRRLRALQAPACARSPTRASRSAAPRAARGGRRGARARSGRDVDADPAVLSLHFTLAGDHARALATRCWAPSARASASRSPTPCACTGARSTPGSAGPRRPRGAGGGVGGSSARRCCVGEPAAATRALTAARRLAARRADRPGPALLPPRPDRRAQRIADGGGALDATRSAVRRARWRHGRAALARAADRRTWAGSASDSAATATRRGCAAKRSRKRRRPASCAPRRAPATRSTGRCSSSAGPTRRRTRGARSRSTGAGRPRTRGQRAQQPRRARLLARTLARGDRSLPARRGGSERAGRPADAFTDGNIGEILSDQGRLDDAAVTCAARAGSGAPRETNISRSRFLLGGDLASRQRSEAVPC